MDDFTEDEGTQPERSDSEWATLRRTEKRAKKAEAELADLQREMAFMKAGIDQNDTRMRYFVRGYDGEFTADAIREAATEAGFLAPPKQEVPAETQQAQQRVANLSSGAMPEQSQSIIAAQQRLNEAMQAGGKEALIAQLNAEGIPIQYE